MNLVYSAAFRMVREAHAAEDVTQAVFVALAQNASRLTNHPVLSGWLHCTTRNLATKAIRIDVRRHAREQEAVAMKELLAAESDASWEDIAPHLDVALGELSELDRDALLLRYFERKSARDIAQILGISDEAAQKRVSRSVERLRALFAKRGVTVGASGLAVVLSTNAVQAAPAGLAVTLAGTAVSTSTVIAATNAIAMTTLRKALITTSIAVLAATGTYEARQAAQLRDRVRTLQQQQALSAEQARQLQVARDAATNRLAGLLAENSRLKSNPNQNELLKLRAKVALLQNSASDPADIAAKDLVARVNKLKQRLEQTPNAKIPELQLLNEQDWLTASRGWDLDSENGVRSAMSGLRGLAEQKFANITQRALTIFSTAYQKPFPTDLSQLQPYFDPPVDASILQRWEILPPGATIPGIGNEGPFVTQKAPVDDLIDRRWAVGTWGSACTDFLNSEIQDVMKPVYQAYSAANNGVYASDPSEYLPFTTTSAQQAAVQKLVQQSAVRK